MPVREIDSRAHGGDMGDAADLQHQAAHRDQAAIGAAALDAADLATQGLETQEGALMAPGCRNRVNSR
ncbi:hypothetical protein [Hankyongella ginsenosidimutans]|uniref:hypothetical protein n=1 Tax=Hankyongella ginsenosidimutans TaxID=1763828 RepID=UPI001CA3758B